MVEKKDQKLNDDCHKLWADRSLSDIRVVAADKFDEEKGQALQGVRRKEFYGEVEKGANRPSKSKGIDKIASIQKEASYDMDFAQTQFYSPRLTAETWYMPKSRKMLLRWVKIFFDWDPYISSILRMSARYPISEFKLNCKSIKQEEFFDAVLHQDNWDIMDTMRIGSLSMQKYGEFFGMGSWNEEYKIWNYYTEMDPALIEVEPVAFTNKVRIYAEIPEKYKKLWRQTGKAAEEAKKTIPVEMIEQIKKGAEYIEFETEEEGIGDSYSPARIFRMTNQADVGESGLRGLPPITCLMRDLVFKDFLKKAQFERAKRFAYPIEFWKLGDVGKGIVPSAEDLKNIQQMIRAALAAPPFSIIYTPLLSLEVVSAVGGLLDIYKDLDFVENSMLIGMGTNKNIVLGEGGWMGAAKTLSMQRQLMDYGVDREMWERKFIKGHVLRALCMAHGAVKDCPITHLKRPDLPKVSWLRSLDPQQEEDNKKLYMELQAKSKISTKTLYSKFPDLDFETEARNLEAEHGTIFDDGKRLPTEFNPIKHENTGGGESLKSPGEAVAPVAPVRPAAPEKPVEEKEVKEKKEVEEK